MLPSALLRASLEQVRRNDQVRDSGLIFKRDEKKPLGHVGVAKIDEVYGRWLYAPASERLDLEKLFASIKELPLDACKVRKNLPASGPQRLGENAEERKSA